MRRRRTVPGTLFKEKLGVPYLAALLEDPLLCFCEHLSAALLNRRRDELPALPDKQICEPLTN